MLLLTLAKRGCLVVSPIERLVVYAVLVVAVLALLAAVRVLWQTRGVR